MDEQLHLDRQLCFALYSASRAVTRAYGPVLAELGLTYPQYLVMLALWEQPGEGHTVGALGRRLDLDSGTLTPLLKRLEATGRVRRQRDPGDERRVIVALTPAGVALRDRAADVPRRMGERFGLAPERIASLIGELTEFSARLSEGSQPSVP